MSEKTFNRKVRRWCEHVVESYLRDNQSKIKRLRLDRLVVGNDRIYTGAIPFGATRDSWKWQKFLREIDIVIGLDVDLEGEKAVVPLIVVELKTGALLSTDELDKKSAIYGPLRELYPWVHTVFLHEDIAARKMGDSYLLRNARHFNTIYKSFNPTTKRLFAKLILQQLEYQIEYLDL